MALLLVLSLPSVKVALENSPCWSLWVFLLTSILAGYRHTANDPVPYDPAPKDPANEDPKD